MDFAQLAEYANHSLTWIGFGTILGLIANAIMPGRDAGGAVATILIGIAGTLIGCTMLRYFYPNQIVDPISMEGFAIGSVGAFALLLFYKVLGGYGLLDKEAAERSRSVLRDGENRETDSRRRPRTRGRRNYALDDE